MAKQLAEITRRTPQAVAPDVPFDGDIQRVGLGDVKNGGTTPVGTSVYNILMGTEAGDSSVAGYKPPGLIGTKACKADTCCVWWYIAQAMTLAFTGPTGRCNGFARAAIRLGFHDAGSWSSSLAAAGQDFGGADGSIILSGTEINRAGSYLMVLMHVLHGGLHLNHRQQRLASHCQPSSPLVQGIWCRRRRYHPVCSCPCCSYMSIGS